MKKFCLGDALVVNAALQPALPQYQNGTLDEFEGHFSNSMRI
jgi:hypothetical protein